MSGQWAVGSGQNKARSLRTAHCALRTRSKTWL